MKNFFTSTALLPIMLSTCAVAPAMAQQTPCVRDYEKQVVQPLYEKYGEVMVGEGLAETGVIVQLFTSEETNTFSIVVIRPDGLVCLAASGTSWSDTPVVPAPPGELN